MAKGKNRVTNLVHQQVDALLKQKNKEEKEKGSNCHIVIQPNPNKETPQKKI